LAMKAEFAGSVSAKELLDFCISVFKSVGVPDRDAEVVAESLVSANLRGVDSHGVLRLSYYVAGIRKGLTNPKPNIKIDRENAVIAVMDGDNGLGQVAAMKATELAIRKAQTAGIGIVGVRNTNHVGMLSYYIMKIVKQKLIGFAFTNGPPSMAPWGGRKKMIGTNPLCVGFPVDGEKSLILDMATSAVSAGKLNFYAKTGRKIPEGWALDKHGVPTTDPKEALKEGTLAPLGGYKGYGLAVVIDVLAGILTGDTVSYYVRSGWEAQGGFLVGAIDITAFRPYEEYEKEVLNYVKLVKSCPPAKGVKEVLLPGEVEAREAEKRLKEGVPIDAKTWSALQKLSEELGIQLPTLRDIQHKSTEKRRCFPFKW